MKILLTMRHYFRVAIKSWEEHGVLFMEEETWSQRISIVSKCQNNDQKPANMFPNIKIKIQSMVHFQV